MYTEQTTIVDCYQNSNEDYVLDMPAKELLEASKTGAVYVRFNHSGQQTIDGVKKDITDYRTSRLKTAYYDGTAYTFAFESGDTYTVTGDGYPVLDGESPSETLSGGGGQLPTPTAQDIGKVATVVGETSKGAVIAPEQTVALSGTTAASITATGANLFVEGAQVIVTIAEDEQVGTVVDETHDTYSVEVISGGVTYTVAKEGGIMSVKKTGSGAKAVSISVHLASTSVAWGIESPSGGGVLVVNGTWNESFTECVLDKTYQEIRDADLAIWKIDDSGDRETYFCVRCSYDPFAQVYYSVTFVLPFGEQTYQYKFYAATESDYPVFSE